MKRLFSHLLGASAFIAVLSSTASAQEYSNGGNGQARGPAIESPVDSFGLNAPIQGAADGYLIRKNKLCTPYYAPLSPTPTFSRWCCGTLTPYYFGYASWGFFKPKPLPYGCGGGCPEGLPPYGELAETGSDAYTFGVYTGAGAGTNEAAYWSMGGNGQVPYGAPPPPRGGPPDIVDMIHSSRGGCPAIESPPAIP